MEQLAVDSLSLFLGDQLLRLRPRSPRQMENGGQSFPRNVEAPAPKCLPMPTPRPQLFQFVRAGVPVCPQRPHPQPTQATPLLSLQVQGPSQAHTPQDWTLSLPGPTWLLQPQKVGGGAWLSSSRVGAGSPAWAQGQHPLYAVPLGGQPVFPKAVQLLVPPTSSLPTASPALGCSRHTPTSVPKSVSPGPLSCTGSAGLECQVFGKKKESYHRG